MIQSVSFAVLAFAITSLSAQAAFRIDDPNAIAVQATQFLGRVPFAQAFKLQDQMQGQTQSCRIVRGKEVCTQPISIVSTVSQVTATSVTLTTQAGSEEPTDFTVTRDMYDRVDGNWILLYLQEGLGGGKPGDKDYATFDRGLEEDFILADGTVIKTYKAWITMNTWKPDLDMYRQSAFALSVAKDVRAVGQLVQVHDQPDKLKTPLFKVTAIKNGP